METILLNNILVSYRITYKNNKHTYFRFKGNNFIEIFASKSQSKKEIIKYMKKNEVKFSKRSALKKKEKSTSLKDEKITTIFNTTYNIYFKEGNDYIQNSNKEIVIFTANNNIDHIDYIYKKFIKKILLGEVVLLQKEYLNIVEFDISNIKFNTRFTSSRYGSCNPSLRTINFNLHLVKYNKIYLEYVFLHEICHLIYKNHSKRFYNLLESICPNYRQLKKELNILFNK